MLILAVLLMALGVSGVSVNKGLLELTLKKVHTNVQREYKTIWYSEDQLR